MKIMKYLTMGLLFIGMTTLVSCKKEGCTDVNATNYSSSAKKDNGSCNYKTPVADFTFYAYSSTEGKVSFTNSSTNADSYEWDFGDGSSSISTNPEHIYSANGNFAVTLKAKTNNGKDNSITKYVQISNITAPATTGECIFWTSTSTYGQIKIQINGGNVGTVTVYSSNGLAPDCGTNGYVTIDRPAGTYSYHAESLDGNWVWNGSVTIANGVCKKIQLT